ncbi:nucleotidyltransferase domain-containing protein [Rheinheimera muenzenbergensis]|uniref:Nucleotidyltransferase domain-containing protein n=1 Tax=Rheinheimera muenzenbergensis TaxID=1193628 RepID=A0ABU8C2Q5_9GAMM|nr:nucleotidyltransferase domain-containing protein [Gammaproteobacteria bacterium]MBU1556430.1 nucleotidyltransferase domain-containing protein [Gammaproteobacteria bacterium]MBU2071986.1 nucleotidyltransferase domain-containing protein [Gammaproteobacteria bacterium]MBU2183929.1 nucleotidyltransferase domain-containing protein [Gammaproteobacteria bacterium]MBU2203317.1 nucleotidyltransferase domain-containing protein [Gammaproteobacteria bacterium]
MLDLAPQHLQILQSILQQHVPGVTVWAFGSRVNGNAKPHSDLDLVLKAASAIPQRQLFALQDALEESDLPIKVDVLDWQLISPEFQQHILKRYLVLPTQ